MESEESCGQIALAQKLVATRPNDALTPSRSRPLDPGKRLEVLPSTRVARVAGLQRVLRVAGLQGLESFAGI